VVGPVRPFNLGWHPIDPGPGPRSKLFDAPPDSTHGNLEAAHRRWRADVEADEARLLQLHLAGPAYHPVPLPSGVNVVPIFGGTAGAIEQVATTLVTSGLESGLDAVHVLNLSGWNLTKSLRVQMQAAKRNRAQFEEVSSRGSTVNLFGNPDVTEVVALLVDSLRTSEDRSAGRRNQQEQQELLKVVRLLRGSATVERIIDAVDVALGSVGAHQSLTIDEVRDLQDFHAGVVSQRRATQDRLADLHLDLEALRGFGKVPGISADVVGAGKLSIRWYDVRSGSSTQEVELGRQLIARAVLQSFKRQGARELLVVVGAERLSDEVRDEMVNTAQASGKTVALMYTQINDAGRRMLGHAGSAAALFLKMPNPADAVVASEYLGREYKFVVNGISIAEGQTQDWSSSYGTSTSQGRSVGTSSSRSSGYGGGGFNFSRSVGSSVTSSFERGTSQTQSSGGSTSATATTSTGRVHEAVVEPEVFQQMPDDMMMIIAKDTVVVASCQNQLRWSSQTSKSHLAIP
jgi:hypothetical protein